MAELHENVIEWIDGDDMISVTLHQKKYVNKILRLSENPMNNIMILARNDDGSIFAHLPISMLKLSPKRQSNIDELRKAELRESMKKAQAARMAKMESRK